jgi:uncharacterized protein YtpQ (UPF0354 family)
MGPLGIPGARYDRAEFAIAVQRPGEDSPAWLFLSNVYAECADSTRDERRDRISRLVRIMTGPDQPETWETVRPRLRPVLRSVTFGQPGMSGSVPPLSRAAMPNLREFIVVDHPESMAYVVPDRLSEWGITVDDVFAAAHENLEKLADESLQAPWPQQNALIRMIDTGDGYFTSLLLSPGWLAKVSVRLGSQIIAFAPDRDDLLLCSTGPGGLGKLYEMVEDQYRDAVRKLSPVGYVAGEHGDVVPYLPPEGHPDRVPAQRAQAVLATSEYAVQTDWLTKQYEQAGIDVYVARLMAAEKPNAAPVTVAVWTDGITSLLPRAQFISFAGADGAGLLVPWSAVAELVDLEPEPLLAPARYRVGGWPSADTMQTLRTRAIE